MGYSKIYSDYSGVHQSSGTELPSLEDSVVGSVAKYFEKLDEIQKNHQDFFNPRDPVVDKPDWPDHPFDFNNNQQDFNFNPDFNLKNEHGYNNNFDYTDTARSQGTFLAIVIVLLSGIVISIAIYGLYKVCEKYESTAATSERSRQQIATSNDTPQRPNLPQSENQDLPPTYTLTTNNARRVASLDKNSQGNTDKDALPPSYDEAVGNIAATAPVCEIDVTPSAPPCYGGATGGVPCK